MSGWSLILKSHLRTHLLWLVVVTLFTVSWLEFSLYVWALRGGLELTDGAVAYVFAGVSLSTPIANVICAIWGASVAAVDDRQGMFNELNARRISLQKRTIPHVVVFLLGIIFLAIFLCWFATHASPFIVQSQNPSLASEWITRWIAHWAALGSLALFMWGCGYYAAIMTRSLIWGTGLACLIPIGFSILPVGVSAELPGLSLMDWAMSLPITSLHDVAQVSSLVQSSLFLQSTFSPFGVIVSALVLILLHVLASSRR